METKEEIRKRLTPLQYQVTQEAGTERAFTGKKIGFGKWVYKYRIYDLISLFYQM